MQDLQAGWLSYGCKSILCTVRNVHGINFTIFIFQRLDTTFPTWRHDAAHGPSTQQSQALEIQNQYSSKFIKFNLNSLEDYDVLSVRVGRG